ncbi:MAG: hypothetical protein II738_00005, partial [Clostridia bacterium]|nr:hypothetical protein [Clostridia bacterium]
MNLLWPVLIAVAFVCAACTGKTAELSAAVVASGAETMAFLLRLAGVLCVWGGLAAVAEKSGLAALCGRALSPLLRLVFPRLKDEKARAAIALNVSANFLGLGNAATPLGIAAMKRLRELNRADGHAAAGAHCVAVGADGGARALRGRGEGERMETVAAFFLPSVVVLIIGYGFVKKCRVFDVFLEGAKGGFRTALNVAPSLLALLLAVDMLRAIGAIDLVSRLLAPAASFLGLPPETVPLTLLSPLSGSGSVGVL